MQCAAEGYASLVRPGFGYGPRLDAVPETSRTLQHQAELPRAYGQPKVADAYLTARDRLATLAEAGWYDVAIQLRPSLEWAVEAMTSGNTNPNRAP